MRDTFLIPVVETVTSLNEVPDRIAVSISIGGCQCECKGCHSPHLWAGAADVEVAGWTINQLVAFVDDRIDMGANAIALLGGDFLPHDVYNELITALAEVAPLAVFTGRFNKRRYDRLPLTWLKTGRYEESLGGLDSDTTNQRFYKMDFKFLTDAKSGCVVDNEVTWTDITSKFKKQNG